MPEKRTYKPLTVYETKKEVLEILNSGNREKLLILPLSIGENFPDWKFAQEICLKLAKSEDEEIRANAILGLAYLARTHGKLDRHLVEPIIIKELKSHSKFKGRIEDAIDDINVDLGWNFKVL